MKMKSMIGIVVMAVVSVGWSRAKPRQQEAPIPVVHGNQQSTDQQNSDAMRVEGERRFSANCGRCHAPPHRFPPRMMATIVRHMRVRATITDKDMRLILYYMTE